MENVIELNPLQETDCPLDQAKAMIDSADLFPVFDRLVHIDGWSKKSALTAIEQYRNFLYLKKKYGSEHIFATLLRN